MSQSSKIARNIILQKQPVTQLTTISTAVTCNQPSGIITTVSSTAAANTTVSFTVNNSYVTAASDVVACVSGYSGTLSTNGIPVVTIGSVSAGSFVVNISNAHATNALSGTVKITFIVC